MKFRLLLTREQRIKGLTFESDRAILGFMHTKSSFQNEFPQIKKCTLQMGAISIE